MKKIHTKDPVKVIAGKDKGKEGVIRRISGDRVVVEGINKVSKHIKKKEGAAGQKIEVESSIHISNVMLVCPKTKKPTRVGCAVSEKGGKSRVAKVSGETLSSNFKKN